MSGRTIPTVLALSLAAGLAAASLPALAQDVRETRDLVFEHDPARWYPRFERDFFKVVSVEAWIGDSGHRFHLPGTLVLQYDPARVRSGGSVNLAYTFTPRDGAGHEYDLERGLNFGIEAASVYDWGFKFGDDIDGDFVPPMEGDEVTLSEQSVEIFEKSVKCVGGISVGLYRSEEFEGLEVVVPLRITVPGDSLLVSFNVGGIQRNRVELAFQQAGETESPELVIAASYGGEIQIEAESPYFRLAHGSGFLRPGFEVSVVNPKWDDWCNQDGKTWLLDWYALSTVNRDIPLDSGESDPLTWTLYADGSGTAGDRAQDAAEEAERNQPGDPGGPGGPEDPAEPDEPDTISATIRNVHRAICKVYDLITLDYFVDQGLGPLPIGQVVLTPADPCLADFNAGDEDTIRVDFIYDQTSPNYILTKGHHWSSADPLPRYVIEMTAVVGSAKPDCPDSLEWFVSPEQSVAVGGNRVVLPFRPHLPDFAVDSLEVDAPAFLQPGDTATYRVHVTNRDDDWPVSGTLVDPADSVWIVARASYERREPPAGEWLEVFVRGLGQQLVTPLAGGEGGWHEFGLRVPAAESLDTYSPLDRVRVVLEVNDGGNPAQAVVWERSFQNNLMDNRLLLADLPDRALGSNVNTPDGGTIVPRLPFLDLSTSSPTMLYCYVKDTSLVYSPPNVPPPSASIWLGFGDLRTAPSDTAAHWSWHQCQFAKDLLDSAGRLWKVWRGDPWQFSIADPDTHSYCFRVTLKGEPEDPYPAYVYVDSTGMSTVEGADDLYYYDQSGLVKGPGGADVARPGTPPGEVVLGLPRPNPASAGAAMWFAIPAPGRVRITVHDLHGRTVRLLRDGALPAGWHREHWDGTEAGGRPVAPGVYHLRFEAAGRVLGRKLVVIR